MIIAADKKNTNIIEYVLYMWHIEDLIRAHDFDLEKITNGVIHQFQLDESIKGEMKLWYKNLIEQMLQQGIADSGHLKDTNKIVTELNTLHISLLDSNKEYGDIYLKTLPILKQFMEGVGKSAQNEIEACLNALYIVWMLKVKKEPISEATKEATDTYSILLSHLSKFYLQKIRK